MKKTMLAVLLAATLAISGCGGEEEIRLSGTVEAEEIDINSEVSGKIMSIEKREGDDVKAGEILARIDSETQSLTVRQQEAVVKMKKAQLSELLAGSRIEQIEQAEAAVKVAKANYDLVKSGNRPQQIEQAEANVKTAKAHLDELKAGNRPQQIGQAEAAVKAAKARLDEIKSGSRPEQIEQAVAAVDNARSLVEAARVNKAFAEDMYNKTRVLAEAGTVSQNELLEAENKLKNAELQLASAETGLQNAEAALKLSEEGATQESVEAAEANYEQAMAQLDLIKEGATEQDILVAEGGYEQALAQLDLIKAGSTSQAIAAAEGAYEQAAAQLELLRNGATEYSIDASKADIEQSEAILEQAKLVVEKCEIKSPVDGVFILKMLNVGDIVTSGTCIGTVSNMNELWVNLYVQQKYLDMVKLEGELELRAVSLPDTAIKGKIVYISDKAEFTPKNIETNDAKENIVFKIKLEILDNLEKLKPGMNIDAVLR